jgi:hypothetical protein
MNIVEIIISIIMGLYLIFAIYFALKASRKYKEIDHEYLDMVPSMFTTIGILGTFGGIAYGLWYFDPNKIENSIPTLLKGLKTAFFASIVGVAF